MKAQYQEQVDALNLGHQVVCARSLEVTTFRGSSADRIVAQWLLPLDQPIYLLMGNVGGGGGGVGFVFQGCALGRTPYERRAMFSRAKRESDRANRREFHRVRWARMRDHFGVQNGANSSDVCRSSFSSVAGLRRR